MEDIPYIYVVTALLLASLVSVTIWSRRSLLWRALALAVGTALIGLAYISLVDLLSRPKPAAMEFSYLDVEEFEVVYADWTEGVAIYLLVRIPDEPEPRFYRLPWKVSLAEQLQEAMQEAGDEKADLKMSNPFFDPDVEDRERLFYATPQPSPARKGEQRVDPTQFVPSDESGSYGVVK
jgi:hypothetical protein